MIKFIKGNCQQIALIEAMLLGTGQMCKVLQGDNLRLWEYQKEFKPVVRVTEYDLLHKGLFPIRLKFMFHDLEYKGSIQTNRKGIERLKELVPETFVAVAEEDYIREDDKVREEIDLNKKYPVQEGNIA